MDVCPECDHPLPLYDLRKEAFDCPYQCEHCMALWWPEAYRGRRDLAFVGHTGSRLHLLAEWVQTRKAVPTIEAHVSLNLRFTTPQFARLTETLQHMASHWGRLHGLPAPVDAQSLDNMACHAMIRRKIGQDTEPSANDKETWILYKSIRRFLMRQAKAHRKCLRHLCKRVCTTLYFLEEPTSDICPEAYAIVFWRAHLEGHFDPSKMFMRQLRRIGIQDWLGYSFTRHGDLPSWAKQRVFALDCLELFEESRRVARQAIADGFRANYYLRVDAVIDWIAQMDGEWTSLNWWKAPLKSAEHH